MTIMTNDSVILGTRELAKNMNISLFLISPIFQFSL